MIVRGFFLSWRRWIPFQDQQLLPDCGVQGERRYIVWLVIIIGHDRSLAAWDVSNRITQEDEEGEGEANKILRTSNCMTEVERQEVSNRRKVTGNEKDGEIKKEARRNGERIQADSCRSSTYMWWVWWGGRGNSCGNYYGLLYQNKWRVLISIMLHRILVTPKGWGILACVSKDCEIWCSERGTGEVSGLPECVRSGWLIFPDVSEYRGAFIFKFK